MLSKTGEGILGVEGVDEEDPAFSDSWRSKLVKSSWGANLILEGTLSMHDGPLFGCGRCRVRMFPKRRSRCRKSWTTRARSSAEKSGQSTSVK